MSHRSLLQPIVGAAVAAIGIAAMAGAIPALGNYTYPIVWWGLLPVIDYWNELHSGHSLWRGRLRHFLSITIPLSVLFWLLYELLNLFTPQWHYRGGIASIPAQVLFGFLSFSTVIPIVVECYWLVAGTFCVPAPASSIPHRWKIGVIVLGFIFLAIPAVTHLFWLDQAMWLGPALLLLPFIPSAGCGRPLPWFLKLAVATCLSGFLWEFLNYWAHTRWVYFVLPGLPHLFEMPVLGYIGFIPFGFSTLVLYHWQLRLRPRIATTVLLYGAAFAALWILTIQYMQRGLWILV